MAPEWTYGFGLFDTARKLHNGASTFWEEQ
jgi:hypothetical protein